jgi:hypothetical protein
MTKLLSEEFNRTMRRESARFRRLQKSSGVTNWELSRFGVTINECGAVSLCSVADISCANEILRKLKRLKRKIARSSG